MKPARRGRGVAGIALLLCAAAASGCAAKKKVRSQQEALVSSEERYAEGLALLERRKLLQAVKVLSSINQYSAAGRQENEPLVRLALADATFYQATDLTYIDARSAYLDFVTLYADHPRAAYAQFQAGMCSLQQVRHPSRDQTETHRAIAELQDVPRQYPASTYADAARSIVREAESRLAEHEILVARFYMKRKQFTASVERLRGVEDQYPTYAEKDKLYYYLGESLIRANNDTEGRIYLDKLFQDYPEDNRYVRLAQKALHKAEGRSSAGTGDAAANGGTP